MPIGSELRELFVLAIAGPTHFVKPSRQSVPDVSCLKKTCCGSSPLRLEFEAVSFRPLSN